MTRLQRSAFRVFGLCAMAGALAMAWITLEVLDLERAEHDARRRRDHDAAIRLALWRMDSWLAPQLAREAARPYFQYRAFYPQQKAYNRVLSEIEPGEVLTPSPLLTYRNDLFPLHFQVDPKGGVTSPQVPTGNWLDLAEGNWGTRKAAPQAELLQRVAAALRTCSLEQCLASAQNALPRIAARDPSQGDEFRPRAAVANVAQQSANTPHLQDPSAESVLLGPLLPIWLGAPSDPRLVFLRRVDVHRRTFYQGFLVDWPRLARALLAQIGDLFPAPGATLQPGPTPGGQPQDRRLATVPAVLDAGAAPPGPVGWTPTRTVLVIGWIALLAAAIALGFTLRSSIALGERRARFASAVTHELRTPLTTFRMYSEMLADDMVQDPAQRARYLATLQREAHRLSRLVENVLCYARLEEGRYSSNPDSWVTGALLERSRPTLEQRAHQADMRLVVQNEAPSVRLAADADAVDQVLFNLVDNACKYAKGSEPPEIELSVAARGERVQFAVRDHGPGIPPEQADAIFAPFDRGGRAAADSLVPGVGLGLALARGLAQDLGGELAIDRGFAGGARFVLTLPASGAAGC